MAAISDLVLVYIEEQPGFFARIEEIKPDVKKDWWQVTFLVLGLPLKINTWILDSSQIAGAPFTMGGTPVRIEKIVSPYVPEPAEEIGAETPQKSNTSKSSGKIVAFPGNKQK